MEKYQIADNINLYIIKDKKYKTVNASMYLHRELKREEVTFNSLLSKVLKNATKKYSSLNSLNIYAERLYGCYFDVNVSKRANVQSIVSSVNTINDKYAGESILERSFELMADLIFEPYSADNSFCDEYVENQKCNLRDDIESLINDKRAYANVRCIEEMCKGEPNSIVEIGYADDIDKIDSKGLYKHYESIIYNSPIDIFIVGDADAEKSVLFFKNYFSKFNFNIKKLNFSYFSSPALKEKFVEDHLDVNQGKLVIGLRTGINASDSNYFALLTGNSIFGSGAHSKLFNNVREKMSLCYYAYSRLDKYNALMLVGSGIEFDKFEKTKNAILFEFENVKSGVFTDDELEIAKEYIISSYKSYEDNPLMLIDYYAGLSFDESQPDLCEACKKVKNITKDDVLNAFKNVNVDTVYFLNGKEEK